MNAEQTNSQNVKALATYNLLRGAAVGGFMTLLPMYMRSQGYSMKNIGGIVSISSIVLSLFLPLIGYLNDRHGPRRMVIASGLLLAAAPLLAAETRSLTILGIAYALFLLSFLSGQPARMSFLAASVPPATLGIAIGLTTSVFSASRTAGPAIAGYIARHLGYTSAFHLISLLALLSLALFILLSRPVSVRRAPRNPFEAYAALLRPPKPFAAVLTLISIDRAAWSLWFPLLSAHLYSAGYTEDLVGLMITGGGVVQTLLLPVAGRLTDRASAWKIFAASEVIGAVTALLLTNPDPAWRAVAGLALLGGSIALWIPAYNTLIARIAGGSGSSYAAANTARSVFSAPSPYIGGRLYDAIGPWAPFAASTALMIVVAIGASTLLPRYESKPRSEPVKRWVHQPILGGVRDGSVERSGHGG